MRTKISLHAGVAIFVSAFIALAATTHAQSGGFHPSIRLGAGLAGRIFNEHPGYDSTFLQVTDAVADYEFCLTPSCRVMMGPYLKLSFFTAPEAAGRFAGGLFTSFSVTDRFTIFAETGIGRATQDIMINKQFGQTAATYDLTLGVRHQLPGKNISLLGGITHESNGQEQGINFLAPGQNQSRWNVGLTYIWVGLGW